MQDYRKLFVWQNAHRLTLDVYADAAKYLAHRPAWELRGQHGAAISVPVEYRVSRNGPVEAAIRTSGVSASTPWVR
jgi:hypothetical protein